MGRGYKPAKGGRGGRGGNRNDDKAPGERTKWRKDRDESSSDEEDDSDDDVSGSDDDDESEDESEDEGPRRPAAGELPPNSDSDDDSDDDDDLQAMMAPREKKPVEPTAEEILATKTKKQLAAEMEKLRLVRERREAQARARIEADGGIDRYKVKKETSGDDSDSDDDSGSDDDSESD